jgi:hypothetical protein
MKDKGPQMRPAFTIEECRMLYKLLATSALNPNDIEQAIFRERLQTSIKKFIAVNSSIRELETTAKPDELSKEQEAEILAALSGPVYTMDDINPETGELKCPKQ